MNVALSVGVCPVVDADIDSVEDQIGVKFPPALREFFLKYNDSTPRAEHPSGALFDHVIPLAPIPLASGRARGGVARTHTILMECQVSSHLIPFGRDPGGDILCVDTTTREGAVVICRMGDGEPYLEDVAPSLESFVADLRPV